MTLISLIQLFFSTQTAQVLKPNNPRLHNSCFLKDLKAFEDIRCTLNFNGCTLLPDWTAIIIEKLLK